MNLKNHLDIAKMAIIHRKILPNFGAVNTAILTIAQQVRQMTSNTLLLPWLAWTLILLLKANNMNRVFFH
jgi:hypothetical protein